MNTTHDNKIFLNKFYTHTVCRLLFVIFATIATIPLIFLLLWFMVDTTDNRYGVGFGIIIISIPTIKCMNFCVKIITQQVIITQQQVIVNSGLIGKKSMEITPRKIESIAIKQGIFGKLFNFGNIEIKGLGGTLDALSFMYAPFYIKETIQNLIAQDSSNYIK